MMLPPALVRVRVQSVESRRRLWIPVFLLWPFVALMAALALPVCALFAALYWRRGLGRPVLLAGPVPAVPDVLGARIACGRRRGGSRVFVSID